ncbi:MAG: sulfurtransferase TusA family protein [Actinobacteria bacterium]|nr:sulfurtransferase TusA family protein [Actinomycetota bacterium]
MHEINCLGMKCPLPIIELSKSMKNYPSEVSFLLKSDDVATLPDLKAWSRMTGNIVTAIDSENFEITRGI